MKAILPWMLAAALALPGMSRAAGLSYSYVEGGYAETEIEADGVDMDGEGYRVTGSLAVGPTYHIIAEYSTAELEVENFDIDVDIDTLSVGFGYNRPINQRADVIGRILYVDSDVEVDSPFFNVSGDDSGLGLQFHLRGQVMERVEAEGGIDYVDIGDEDTTLVLEGRYWLTDALALGAGLRFGDDTTSYGVSLRFNFRASVTP
ncbi:MAG TPA: outer membrane beta-barrel protein [Steroidobacteraceae bacterium]|nr:outer membrane beta-barrel protein [Steroidobacteraceae bacterium]